MPPRVPIPLAPSDPVLFVSAVDGKPVTRYPLPGSKAGREIIGAHRDGKLIVYDEEAVVAITRAEVEAHGKAYERAIRDGNLRRRTREEWEVWRARQKAGDAVKNRAQEPQTTTPDAGGSAGPRQEAPGTGEPGEGVGMVVCVDGVARGELHVVGPAAPAGGDRA